MPMLSGVLPILPTIFTAAGAIDEAGTRRVVEYIIAAGARGIVFPGLASEYETLSRDERLGAFYAEFFADLASGTARAWSLVLGPLLTVSAVRLLFLKRPTIDQGDDEEDAAPGATGNRRQEPSVHLD